MRVELQAGRKSNYWGISCRVAVVAAAVTRETNPHVN